MMKIALPSRERRERERVCQVIRVPIKLIVIAVLPHSHLLFRKTVCVPTQLVQIHTIRICAGYVLQKIGTVFRCAKGCSEGMVSFSLRLQ